MVSEKNRNLNSVTALLSLGLFFLMLTPGLTDIPVDPEVQQRVREQSLEARLKGLSASQRLDKVKEMLAEIPLRKAEIDRECHDSEKHLPEYMFDRRKRALDEEAAFLRQWLNKHEKTSHSSDESVVTQGSHIPPRSPLSLGMALGLCFLLAGMLFGARRMLSPGPKQA